VSAVPGRGGRPTGQPIHVRRIMEEGGASDADGMLDYLRTADGVA
jgi:hypothetical protein